MSQAMCVESLDRAAWHEAARGLADYNYRQLWAFGTACAERVGAESRHVAVKDGQTIVGLADVRIKHTPVFKTGIAYITGGPMVRRGDGDEADAKRFADCLLALREQFSRREGLVLRITAPLGPAEWVAKQREIFASQGFEACGASEGYRTMVVNVDRDEAELRSALHQKWRNCLNRAQKNDLEVRSGDGEELFDTFCGLFEELLDRKSFDVDLHARFYQEVQRQMGEGERFSLSVALADGKAVAGHVGSHLGDTSVYLLGACNDEGNQVKASYLLQWHAMLTARAAGCKWYDLGGIDPDGNPGVYHFKQRMGGEEICAAGPFEAQPGWVNRQIVRGAERLYRMVKGRGKQKAAT